MTLWLVLTVISIVAMAASWFYSKIYSEPIDDDTTLSGMVFAIGVVGAIFFGAITILCI